MEIKREDSDGSPAARPSERQMRAMLEVASRQWGALAGSDDANTLEGNDPGPAAAARGWSVLYHHRGLVLATDGSAAYVVGARGEQVVALRVGGDE